MQDSSLQQQRQTGTATRNPQTGSGITNNDAPTNLYQPTAGFDLLKSESNLQLRVVVPDGVVTSPAQTQNNSMQWLGWLPIIAVIAVASYWFYVLVDYLLKRRARKGEYGAGTEETLEPMLSSPVSVIPPRANQEEISISAPKPYKAKKKKKKSKKR